MVEQARMLLTPNEAGPEFQQKYFISVQESPEVVLAHAEFAEAARSREAFKGSALGGVGRRQIGSRSQEAGTQRAEKSATGTTAARMLSALLYYVRISLVGSGFGFHAMLIKGAREFVGDLAKRLYPQFDDVPTSRPAFRPSTTRLKVTTVHNR